MKEARILIVEDELIIASDLRKILTNFGYEVTSIAISAEEAIKKAEFEKPDLVLMDIVLNTKMSGIFAADQIRKSLDIPVIYLTSYSNKKTMERAKRTEPYGYLLKPIQEKPLYITIEMALYHHKVEKRIRHSEEKYRLLVENMSEGLIKTDKNGVVTFLNTSFIEKHGFSPAEILGRNAADFMDEKSQKEFKNQLSLRKKSIRSAYELTLNKKDGSKLMVLVSPWPIYDSKGKYKETIAVVTDITELRLTQKELRKAHEDLQNLSAHLQSVKEEESKRIAREIHDKLSQALTVLKMDLSWVARKAPKEKKPHKMVAHKIKSMMRLIDNTILAVQRISSELRPGLLDDLGLVPAVEWQAQEFEEHTKIPCKLNINCEDESFGPEISTALFRIFQEVLTNVIRHAHATRVNVSLSKHASKSPSLELIVKDNGRGIAEDKVKSPMSYGIVGIRERLRRFDGTLEITGVAGKGTTLKVTLPLQ